MNPKAILVKLHWLLASQFGLDLRCLLRSLRGIPTFIHDWFKFRKIYTGRLLLKPCLHDRYEEGGATKGEYFWQDLLVAQWIHSRQPDRHVDVGSRVDGFVAHVAAFREIEVFDVRPISSEVPGIIFRQADLMNPDSVRIYTEGVCDSLSCLHAIEHFGLGRYGDPIDPAGHERSIANMVSLLEPGGTFYLSTPIGQERVEFNSNRVFDPHSIIKLVEDHAFVLQKLTVINSGGEVQEVQATPAELQALSEANYNLGIFVFVKN